MIAGKAVLVVEDDGEIRDLYRFAFEAAGLKVREVGTRAEAVAARQRPACVILDWNLPDGSGLDVAQALHQRWGAALPIILVTSSDVGPREFAASGAVCLFSKPFDLNEVVGTIEGTVARRQRRPTPTLPAPSPIH
ncbi:MAG TPA: response regulator [Chloroflexota bacterium]|nr:response regulator [Chloroflexota bacterium]